MHKPTIAFRSPPAKNPLIIMEVPNGRLVVNTLHAQCPPRALRYSLMQQFTKPHGFWVRAHAACGADWILPLYTTRAQRGAA